MTTTTTPACIDELDSDWLTGALRRSDVLATDASVRILKHERLTTGTAFATKMYRLHLDGPETVPPTAILKLPVTGDIREFIDGVGAYSREITFYRVLASDVPIRVPLCYVAEMSSTTTDFVLLLEDLAGLTPADQLTGLTLSQAEAAVDDLARLHAWSWEHARLARLADSFPPLDGPVGRGAAEVFARFYAAAWPGARAALGDTISAEVSELAEHLPALLPTMIGLLGSPRTITHSELRADNLFVGDDGTLTMIDFQTVSQASGMLDISYVLSQSLPTALRRGNDEMLVRRYWNELRHGGVPDYSWETAWEQYRVGCAYNAIWAGMAYGQIERLDVRGQDLVMEMLRRACAAMDDNDSAKLLR
jgi:Ecdysteroid kinase-like family